MSQKYKSYKIGFALDISDHDKMFQIDNYSCGQNIYNWERHFWNLRIEDDEYTLYYAGIDTTFCLICKHEYRNEIQIRVADAFTVKHLPWYIENKIMNIYDLDYQSGMQTRISTISQFIMNHISSCFSKVEMDSERIFMPIEISSEHNSYFYQNIQSKFNSYNIFVDVSSNKDNYVNIVYASRKFSQIIIFDSNTETLDKKKYIMEINKSNDDISITFLNDMDDLKNLLTEKQSAECVVYNENVITDEDDDMYSFCSSKNIEYNFNSFKNIIFHYEKKK